MKKHLNIRVIGLVQGVWFRKNTKEKAIALGISGFVRNELDGSVYIEAEGESEVLEEFKNWCEHGPKLASVEKVLVNEGTFIGLKGFIIEA